MPIVTKVLGRKDDLPANAGIDPVLLNSEDRARGHFVAETASGRTLRVSLPRGAELQDGDVLLIDKDWAVVVSAAEEDLLFVAPGADPIEWWAACYQLGNLHRPARFLDDGFLTPADPMAENMLAGLGARVERVRRPFVGRRFGAAHTHHHPGHDAVATAGSQADGAAHGHDHPASEVAGPSR